MKAPVLLVEDRPNVWKRGILEGRLEGSIASWTHQFAGLGVGVTGF